MILSIEVEIPDDHPEISPKRSNGLTAAGKTMLIYGIDRGLGVNAKLISVKTSNRGKPQQKG